MYGYIYKTTNLKNNKIYIGKHAKSEYDPTYLGSGILLKRAISKYGKENFINEIIDVAESLEELNIKEINYISEYRELYGENCYNIADGGDGGNNFINKSENEMLEFKEKMTKINKERCNTPEFKEKISKASSKRYEDPLERQKHSEKLKNTWNKEEYKKLASEIAKEHWQDENFRKKVSEGLSNYWDGNDEAKKTMSKKQKEIWTDEKREEHSKILKASLNNPELKERQRENMKQRWSNEETKNKLRENMSKAAKKWDVNKGAESRKIKIEFSLNNKTIIFNSKKELDNYLLENYDFSLSSKQYKKLIENDIEYISRYRKYDILTGMKIRKVTESVTTRGDECNPVD